MFALSDIECLVTFDRAGVVFGIGQRMTKE